MGGKSAPSSNGTSDQASALAGVQADIAQSLFQDTGKIRRLVFGQNEDFLSAGGANQQIDINSLAGNPMFNAIKAATESQFRNAQDNLIANTASGGAQTGALGNLELGRANQLATGLGALAADQQAQNVHRQDVATSIATGVPVISLGGLGSAGSTLAGIGANQAAMANAQAQQNAAGKGAAGTALGTAAAKGFS